MQKSKQTKFILRFMNSFRFMNSLLLPNSEGTALTIVLTILVCSKLSCPNNFIIHFNQFNFLCFNY